MKSQELKIQGNSDGETDTETPYMSQDVEIMMNNTNEMNISVEKSGDIYRDLDMHIRSNELSNGKSHLVGRPASSDQVVVAAPTIVSSETCEPIIKVPEMEVLKMKKIVRDDIDVLKREEIRATRKRKAKSDDVDLVQINKLVALNDKHPNEVKITLIIDGKVYDFASSFSRDASSPSYRRIGKDGNQHYCQVCRGFGDVVCCDGCPQVYHHACIPLQSLSRISLDNDDDPWFCPDCIENKLPGPSQPTKNARGVEKIDRVSSHKRCVDCLQVRPDLKLVPCEDCGAYTHSPACVGDKYSKQKTKIKKVVCLNCQVIDQDYETNSDTNLSNEKAKQNKRISQHDKSDTESSNGDNNERNGSHVVSAAKVKKTKVSTQKVKNSEGSNKKLKKKKKERKRSASTVDQIETEDDDVAAREQSIKDDPILKPRGSSTTVQAIPAFCFYLAENRWKIERALSRKHRTFNRLPKGDERNALVAQEAAVWWTRLDTREHTLYINMSIRDFESRVILWKEEKDAREFSEENNMDEVTDDDGDDDGGYNLMDKQLTFELHDRLYLSTSVGSKSYKLEANQSYNRVLLDLLHDTRFHPLPMFNVNRADADDENMPTSTIPFFEVHGPISTSLGDECLGCSRGWTHFCSVLQRRVPAIEQRAKLQAPISSLLATRIGLGLRPRFDEDVDSNSKDTVKPNDDNTVGLYEWRDSYEKHELSALPNVPSCVIFDPKNRADDIALFIEETVAMKIPEPPRPSNPEKSSPKKTMNRILPTQRNRDTIAEKEEDSIGDTLTYNKCGRCRTMIPNDTGCIPCRRAQLVINKSKIVPAIVSKHSDGIPLKVHATMLGRLNLKESASDSLNESDRAVSDAMLKVHWCPSTVLPPQKIYTPTPKSVEESDHIDYDEDDDVSVNTDDVTTGRSDDLSKKENDSVFYNRSISTNVERLLELAEVSTQMAHEVEVTDELPKTHLRPSLDAPESNEIPSEPETLYEPPNKRLRPRLMSLAEKETILPESDRPQLQKHYKKESSEIHKKINRIACYGVLHAVLRRDPLQLFDDDYSTDAKNYLGMRKIKENLASGQYTTLSALVCDIRLLCNSVLSSNPPASILYKTANDIMGALNVLNSRASSWLSTIKAEHIKFLQQNEPVDRPDEGQCDSSNNDPFVELRKFQPHIVAMLDQEDVLTNLVSSDFRRTVENETAYYGYIAIQRAAAAAEASLAQYSDSCGPHSVVAKRKYFEDEDLRVHIDNKVTQFDYPQLKNVSTWREEATLRLIRKIQKLRLERRLNTDSGCSRCNMSLFSGTRSAADKAAFLLSVRAKKKSDIPDAPRVDSSRGILATGLASAKTCQRILQRGKKFEGDATSIDGVVIDTCVSVRGSKIHGMGLFADQPFAKSDIVAEYVGVNTEIPVTEDKEIGNDDHKAQKYQFRLDDKYVIDATARGGWARYINHSCAPNCSTVIVAGEDSKSHLRRVLIVAKRNIEFNEEILYDYQIPLELDLNARIPCNCQSESCRGFMNWNIPEKGNNNRLLLIQKRGANMRDRIRRLGRPLKRGEI